VRIAVGIVASCLLFAGAPPLVAAAPSAAERFLTARLAADEGRIDEALAMLAEAVAIAGESPYLELERAQLLARVGRLDEASAAIAEARRLAPQEPEVYRQQGRIEMGRLGDDEHAVETAKSAWEELRRFDPSDLEALVSLGQLYLASGQMALAVEVLDEAQRLRPDHPWIQSLRARALSASGDSGAAERLQREALERDPGDLRARFELSERLARAGEHRQAAELLAAAPERQRLEPELQFRLARQLFLAGEPERARELAAKVLEGRPEAVPARLLSARTAIALGYFAEAEATLAPVAARATDDPVAGELFLRAYEGQEKWTDAARLLEARRDWLQRQGDTQGAEAAALDLARILAASERWSEAAAMARSVAASADPGRAEAGLRTELRAQAAGGDLDAALARLDQRSDETAGLVRLELLLRGERRAEAAALAARLTAAASTLELSVGGLLQDGGQYESALPYLERSLRREPESLEASFRVASCLERLGRHDEAIAEFRRLVARAPGFAPALNYLGYLWIERRENLEQAVTMVREAVRLDPDNGAYVDSLGWGLFQSGRFEDAVRALERAARLLPRDATVLEHLGDARAAQGDLAGAREAYARALAAGPESAEELERKSERLGGDS
jgi:tetratricopeptide (TPR) repeat protein